MTFCPSSQLLLSLRRSLCAFHKRDYRSPCVRRSLTQTAQAARPNKPYYVTSPIFYVNAEPHIGHLYTLILTDVLKRWRILRGEKAILCTGTDEHGMKIQQAAAKAGIDPQAFCDKNYQAFQKLSRAANIEFDHFIRTSEPEHRFAVQHFWLMLKERGLIYASKHEGWYSVSDEAFYPESSVHLTLDNRTGRKVVTSKETGKEVEWTSEQNYHFRLSQFRDQLLDFYAKHPNFVMPDTRMKEVIKSVQDGLEDLSISRPVERLTWGIPVPDDNSQTIYVWLDALINYLTKADYPFQNPGQEDAAGWPANIQVIGKDIVRFHCVYWPAFLMALDIPLPHQFLTHAHWLLGNRKMSKSVGNVVNPFFALDRFGVDVMRYYMVHDGGIRQDASYENSFIVDRWKKDLHGGLGGLASRVTRTKRWSIQKAVEIVTGEPESHIKGEASELLRDLLFQLPEGVNSDFEKLEPNQALKRISSVIRSTNHYIQISAPWNVPKGDVRVHGIIYLCAESLRIAGILLQPYMPDTSKHLLDTLGVRVEARGYVNASLGSDQDYGVSFVPLGRGLDSTVLFPPLKSEF